MKRLALALGVLCLILSSTARADDSAKPDNDQSVALSTVALPIVVNGHLVNYIFVGVKIWLTPRADAFALRDKEPYFRDALVRAAHRTPFVLANDYNHVDEAKLDASLFHDAQAIVGPGLIQRVQVLSQTPQHNLSTPH